MDRKGKKITGVVCLLLFLGGCLGESVYDVACKEKGYEKAHWSGSMHDDKIKWCIHTNGTAKRFVIDCHGFAFKDCQAHRVEE